jgi:hypothetical protein
MTYPITTKKTYSPLSIARGAVRSVFSVPHKIATAVRRIKDAAASLVERVRSAVRRRPIETAQARPPLAKLPGPSGTREPRADPVIDSLWKFKKQVEVSSNLQATHDSFLKKSGHHLSHREVNGLKNAIQHPESYPTILAAIIMGLEQDRRT